MIRLLPGDCRTVLPTLPDASVQCVVTSPPYYGLRDYGTAQWQGGDAGCEHSATANTDRTNRDAKNAVRDDDAGSYAHPSGWRGGGRNAELRQCRCGARRIDAQIGLEATPEAFIAELVAVFREVKRVLRDDGTLWCNLGDNFRDKQLQMMPARVALALQDDGWILRSDIIWCLSGGTRVYARTQKGEMPMTIKDMVRLDPAMVQLWNGEKWTQVLGWNETLRPDRTYEIELRNGQRIGCTGNHEWPTENGNIRADELRVGDVIRRCRLPEPAAPRSPSWLMDELAGWFVGLYIAEGSRYDGTINIASHSNETERFERLSALAAALDGDCAVHKTSDNGSTVALKGPMLCGLIDTYVSGELASGKHLHSRCWKRSDDFLLAVLNGYLAGDGHYDAGNDRWRLAFCTNDELVADLRTMGARLGVSVRLRRHLHQFAGREFPGYRGEVRFTRSAHLNNRDDGEIVAIRESRARKFWDIGVADEPHLFALASGLLTHNSKPNPMPESVTDRCVSAHEHIFLLTKKPRYFFDNEAIREEAEYGRRDTAGAWRGGAYVNQKPGQNNSVGTGLPNSVTGKHPESGRSCRNVWWIATAPFPAAHFATFPPELAERCIRAGTSERGCCANCGAPWAREVEKQFRITRSGNGKAGSGNALDPSSRWAGWDNGVNDTTTTGWSPSCQCIAETRPCTILDPFSGAGTALLVADRLGRDAIGIDLSHAYVEMARQRLEADCPLFTDISPPPAEDPEDERMADLFAIAAD